MGAGFSIKPQIGLSFYRNIAEPQWSLLTTKMRVPQAGASPVENSGPVQAGSVLTLVTAGRYRQFFAARLSRAGVRLCQRDACNRPSCVRD